MTSLFVILTLRTFKSLNINKSRLITRRLLTMVLCGSCFESRLVLESPLCPWLYCARRMDGGIMLLISCTVRITIIKQYERVQCHTKIIWMYSANFNHTMCLDFNHYMHSLVLHVSGKPPLRRHWVTPCICLVVNEHYNELLKTFNLLSPDIKMHNYSPYWHSLYTFLRRLVRWICLNIKTSYSWWSLPLFSSLGCLNK